MEEKEEGCSVGTLEKLEAWEEKYENGWIEEVSE